MSIGHYEDELQGTFYTEPLSDESAVMTYIKQDQVIHVNSTRVPEQFRGQGIAMQLMVAMVAFAQEQQLKVVPECSYVEVAFKRQPQWQHLLADTCQ
ncbi:GNAT family N-acetyltransferase [Motilimonas cestriensis]|uniref:GNAT family N-acetyltransferase n=1 Tax=Motilimonas cestriensis TaxID=2742685 RepID=UPI003DA50C00